MRAVVQDRYGPADVLRVEEVEPPVPAAGEVLVRVHASTVNRTDVGLRAAKPWFSRFFVGLRRPRQRIPGIELAGVVEAVGEGGTRFAVDDRVFGVRSGAHAELVCVREAGPVAHMPEGSSFEEAAALCDGAALALACLRKAWPLERKRVLVYGASGAVGTAAVQLARHFGAHVTAVTDTTHLELVRSLGAHEVVDYLEEDFARRGETYDVVFDAVGKHSFRRSRRAIARGGVFVETDGGFLWHAPALVLLTRFLGDRHVHMGITRYSQEDAVLLKGLVEAGEFRPVVDRSYPLEDVAEAHRYVETGRKTGNVVLTIAR